MIEYTTKEVAKQLKRTDCAWVEVLSTRSCYGNNHALVYYLYVRRNGAFADSREDAYYKFRYVTPYTFDEYDYKYGGKNRKNSRAEFEALYDDDFSEMAHELADRATAWFADSEDYSDDEEVAAVAKTIRESGCWTDIEDETAQLCRRAGLRDEYDAVVSSDWASLDSEGISFETLYARAAELLGVEIY